MLKRLLMWVSQLGSTDARHSRNTRRMKPSAFAPLGWPVYLHRLSSREISSLFMLETVSLPTAGFCPLPLRPSASTKPCSPESP
jgi:hypothetical protein